MIIEKLKQQDIAKYKKLIDICFDGSNEIKAYNYDENDTNYTIIVAKNVDEIVGSITLYRIDLFTFSFQPILEIFNVCVKKEYRGKKIAKTMFEYVFDFAKKNGYNSINLTCLDTAYDAHHLYESLGFNKTNSVKYNLTMKQNN